MSPRAHLKDASETHLTGDTDTDDEALDPGTEEDGVEEAEEVDGPGSLDPPCNGCLGACLMGTLFVFVLVCGMAFAVILASFAPAMLELIGGPGRSPTEGGRICANSGTDCANFCE